MHTATELASETIMKLNGNVLQVIPLNVTVTLTRWVKTVQKISVPDQKEAMAIIPSCGPSPKFKNTRKLNSQQKSSAQTGTPRFVTLLNILGAFFRSANPYNVRDAMYNSESAAETMKMSKEALIT